MTFVDPNFDQQYQTYQEFKWDILLFDNGSHLVDIVGKLLEWMNDIEANCLKSDKKF